MRRRIVVDTNVYVSRFLRPSSVPGLALAKAAQQDLMLISTPMMDELRTVLLRPKFAAYVSPGLMEPFLRHVWITAQLIEIPTAIRACRDPRDDKFLEVAVHGQADAILTGDEDLLALDPFRGVRIVSPADYLAWE